MKQPLNIGDPAPFPYRLLFFWFPDPNQKLA